MSEYHPCKIQKPSSHRNRNVLYTLQLRLYAIEAPATASSVHSSEFVQTYTHFLATIVRFSS